jgi:hypothetical protein
MDAHQAKRPHLAANRTLVRHSLGSGQKRRFDRVPVTSGPPPTSDMALHRTT